MASIDIYARGVPSDTNPNDVRAGDPTAPDGGSTSVTPGVGDLSVTGFAPSVVLGIRAFADVGALTAAGLAPSAVLGTRVYSDVGSLVATGASPSIVFGTRVLADVGALSVTGFAPSVRVGVKVLAGVGALVVTGFAPTVSATRSSVETVRDRFSGSSLNSLIWDGPFCIPGGSVSEAGGTLDVSQDDPGDDVLIRTKGKYIVRDKMVYIQVDATNLGDAYLAISFRSIAGPGQFDLVQVVISAGELASIFQFDENGYVTSDEGFAIVNGWIGLEHDTGADEFRLMMPLDGSGDPLQGWEPITGSALPPRFDLDNAFLEIEVLGDGFITGTEAIAGNALINNLNQPQQIRSVKATNVGSSSTVLIQFTSAVFDPSSNTAPGDLGARHGFSYYHNAVFHALEYVSGLGTDTLVFLIAPLSRSDSLTVYYLLDYPTPASPLAWSDTGEYVEFEGFSAENDWQPDPGTGALSLTGFAPTASIGIKARTDVGVLTVTGFAPSCVVGARINTGVGDLAATGFAPAITLNIRILPDVGALVLTGFSPSVTVGFVGGVTVTPGTGQLFFDGFAPDVAQSEEERTTIDELRRRALVDPEEEERIKKQKPYASILDTIKASTSVPVPVIKAETVPGPIKARAILKGRAVLKGQSVIQGKTVVVHEVTAHTVHQARAIPIIDPMKKKTIFARFIRTLKGRLAGPLDD